MRAARPHAHGSLRLRDLGREVVAATISQRVFSAMTFLVLCGATLAVLLTAGRAAAAQSAVLGAIDSQGTRRVVVQLKGEHDLFTTSVVDQLASLDLVESVIGLGRAQDVTASALPQRAPTGLRPAYGQVLHTPLDPTRGLDVAEAWTSDRAAHDLGLPPGHGSVVGSDERERLVTRRIDTPPYLADFEPLVLSPLGAVCPASTTSHTQTPCRLTTIVVLARSPRDVEAVTTIAQRLTAGIPPDDVTIETSGAMAELRRAVSGELMRSTRGLVMALLAASAALAFINVWSMVLMRRRDFGRRRALGATRLTIVMLIVLQVLLLGSAGAAAGAIGAWVWLSATQSQTPPATYALAVCLALVAAATVAAAAPAAFAARRDPLAELRVP